MSSSSTSSTEVQRIAGYVSQATLEQVPDDLLSKARLHLLDTLGVALAASSFEFAQHTHNGVSALGEPGRCTVLGFGGRLSPAWAALLNGTLAHGLDFDDTHIGGVFHASATVLPAALAVAQATESSGSQLLLAYVLGLEVGCRMALGGQGSFTRRGFHPTALCGPFAAATAAGKLLGLTSTQQGWALGICGSQAGGVLQLEGSWLKRLHAGWAAHSGVVAATLARAGFLGPVSMIEGPAGFYATHAAQVPQGVHAPSHLLGEVWHAADLALKPHACCGFLHAAVDAALELREQFELQEVERIDCLLAAELHPLIAQPREACVRPADPYRALFSAQYAVALALVRGRANLSAFHDEPLDAADVLAMAEKVHCLPDPQSDFPARFPGELRIHLKSGRALSLRRAAGLGTPEVPWSRGEALRKFMSNATRAIPQAQADELAHRVLQIERERDLAPLLQLACAPD